jgi:hypothetical protein
VEVLNDMLAGTPANGETQQQPDEVEGNTKTT